MKKFRVKWLVLWSLWAASVVQQPTTPVRVSGGWVRGTVALDGSHVQYLSIPYATVDRQHRFKAAGPEPKWEGVFDAVNENVRCLQRFAGSLVLGQENCLTLNVYTPMDATPDNPLPVMIYIHGGGYFEGSSSRFLYGPDYLVAKKVIVVNINYRVNVQGFACLGIREAPGNAGMKDQVAALKWVKRNIAAFGGDSENVTIFGASAGASSVSHHVLSPMSKGLFHKAIIQSGSGVAWWSYQPGIGRIDSLLAKSLEYETEDPRQLYEIFMNTTDEKLILTRIPRYKGNLIASEAVYVPCIERVIEGVETFLSELPYSIYMNEKYNKVPMMIGSNDEEGFLIVGMENDTIIPEITVERSLPNDLEFPTEAVRHDVANQVSKLYLGDQNITKETRLLWSKLHGEQYFRFPVQEETRIIVETNDKPVYNYLFQYSGWRNFARFSAGPPMTFTRGATHADDVFYLFKQMLVPTLFEGKMINRMTTLWTNFAKYGNPTPEVSELLPIKWPRVEKSSPKTLVIDDEMSIVPLWHTKSLQFWRDVYKKYRKTDLNS